MPNNVSRTLGREAQRSNILAAKVVADIVKTTLGPKGMDKMLVDSSGNIIVTNDGVTILEEMEIDHPAARMMVEIAKTQETEVGDGTTTAALLAGKLLENAEKLIERKIHPTIIASGYKIAGEKALEFLNQSSYKLENREMLKKIAMTAMTGKSAEGSREKLSEIILSASEQIAVNNQIDIEDIKIQKVKGESIENSELIKGIVIGNGRANSDMPSRVEDSKILLIDFPIEVKGTEIESKLTISSPEQLDNFIASEERHLRELTDRIINSGANVVFCQKGIDDVAQYYLAKAGVFCARRISKSDMEKISRATSGKIVSNIHDLMLNDLGRAGIVEELKIGDESLTYIRECSNPRAVTIVIRGAGSHIIDEVERAIRDGLGDVIATLKDGKIVAGGGAIEIELAKKLRAYAKTFGGREQLAIEEFANSLEAIPETLAENAGLDPIDIVAELKKRHELGNANDGLNLFINKIEDTFKVGIVEPLKVKSQAISSASEMARMILRIDDVLISKNSENKLKTGLQNPDDY